MSEDDPRKVLLAQAQSLGMEIDGRWSVDTLAEKVQEAQEAKSAADIKAVREASDTWVTLLRDAFPVENEKRLAGETVKVPADMAKAWYKARVAIPGDAPNA